mmetsp:Transcript_34225/g.41365  ORF Transcript_34225/g.41365 Transcript_34225/m.41365 type:complete len:258 (+) Transcript_34225:441-1214(+)|eukprot:CAMPEP_0197859458 /NCGR_PEP_ID=MMETSP1438-20131217/34026_1 /TAXON_ID=1461541 /ORGANISM="Pterosperma sp., Strain CCMP1384" /LENGTH=257 /DNA_ID=CAMNT_0043475949 /DNA_START=222 /DNA_END=995 /DNA_ORIENTATION=-
MWPPDAEELVSLLKEETLGIKDYIRSLEECTSAGEHSPKVTQLNETLRQRMSALRKLMEELELLADEQDREEDMKLLMDEVNRYQTQYNSLKESIKEARQNIRKATVQAAEDERKLLWSGQEEEVKRRRLESEAEMVTAAEEATDVLRRTRQMMAQELEHTGKTAESLRNSTAALSKTETELQSQQQSLGTAKKLLSFLQKQEVIDRLVTTGAFTMFLLVVAHIVLKRTPVLAHLHPMNWGSVTSQTSSPTPAQGEL